MKRSTWVEIISSLFILLFLYTAISKLIDFETFRNGLHAYPAIREKANIIAWFVPISEIAVSTLLFFPKSRKSGLWGSLALMLIFTAYIAYMLFFSKVRACSCGGVIEKMTWNQHFIFNILFTLLAMLGLWLNKRRNKQYNKPLKYSTSPV
jgi:hypothetical protein